jgi:hypothetical protein
MRGTTRIGALIMAGLMLGGCYGPFHLTRRVHTWNGQVGDKWVNEFVFLVLGFLPVYGLALAGDVWIFNAIEFWTGENPMAKGPTTKTFAKGDTKTVVTYLPQQGQEQMIVQHMQKGQPTRTLHLERRDGVTLARDQQGDVVFIATSLADGGVSVQDAEGRDVAKYSPQDVEQFYRTLPQ